MARHKRMTQMPNADRCTADAGFTMTELLITMLLLSVVLIGMASLQIAAIRQVTVSKNASEATRLAQLVLERYQHMPYLQIAAISPKRQWIPEMQRDGVSPMTNVGPDGESGGPFRVDTFHESFGAGELVTVRVTWATTDRTLGDTIEEQYRQPSVALALQRFP